MGSAASSPLSGRSRRALRYLSGEGLGKVCVCCWQSARWEARAGGRRGSSLLLSGSGWGCSLGAAERLWRPAPGARPARGGRGGGRRTGGSEGRTSARRWDRSAGAESGAGARPRRRSADSGAAGAGGGGGGEAAGKEAAAQSRSRPASMGRLAPRPLLLALLALGECARGSARRGGTVGAPGARRGAAAARAAWAPRVPAPLPGDPTGVRGRRGPAGEDGGASREPGAGPARQRAGGSLLSARPSLAPHTCGGEWLVAGCPQPSLPVGRREPGSP